MNSREKKLLGLVIIALILAAGNFFYSSLDKFDAVVSSDSKAESASSAVAQMSAQSVGTSQVHVAAAVVKREVEKTKLKNLNVVVDKFPFENGTVYWNISGKKVVFLEGVTTWTIAPDSESVGSDSRKVVKLAVALQGSNSGEIVYEFHPLWEADK